jgi:NAD+ kinase
MDAATAAAAPGATRLSPARFARSIDVLLSLGGDGTLLRALHALKDAPVPILGINLGHLGFLTSVPDIHAADALRRLAAADYTIHDRPLLSATLVRGTRRKTVLRTEALNDIVVGWGTVPRVASLSLDVDGTRVATFSCDGMIIATPTGSTGHALSAGGPILHCDTPAIVVEAICPHTLSNRPLVLPDSCAVALTLNGTQRTLVLSIDGRNRGSLEPGDRLEIRKSPRAARFVRLPGQSWFDSLSRKLHWRGSSAIETQTATAR